MTTNGELAWTHKTIAEKSEYLDKYNKGYETSNISDENWNIFKDELQKFKDIDAITIDNPIYFKLTDKQYFFNPENPSKLKKHLSKSLNKLLDGAISIIKALEEIDDKTLSDEELKIKQRKQKLIELLLKSGKIDLSKVLK